MNKFKTISHKIRNIPSRIKNMPKTIREYPVACTISAGIMGYLSAYAIRMCQVARYVSSHPGGDIWKGYDFKLVDFPFPKMGEYVDPRGMDILPIVPDLDTLDHVVYSIFFKYPVVGIPLLIAIVVGVGYGTFKLGRWVTKKYRGEI